MEQYIKQFDGTVKKVREEFVTTDNLKDEIAEALNKIRDQESIISFSQRIIDEETAKVSNAVAEIAIQQAKADTIQSLLDNVDKTPADEEILI